jgi:cyclophilin family peptidyl-prolyl cis-trans isomerase
MTTNMGIMNIELDCDITPRTCENFLELCEKGYYNNVKFHRLIKNFMVRLVKKQIASRRGSRWHRSRWEIILWGIVHG